MFVRRSNCPFCSAAAASMPAAAKPLQMVVMLTRINHVNRLVATLEPVLDEGEQDAILFFFTIEKRADMTRVAELGSGKGDGRSDPAHFVVSYMGNAGLFTLALRNDAFLVTTHHTEMRRSTCERILYLGIGFSRFSVLWGRRPPRRNPAGVGP